MNDLMDEVKSINHSLRERVDEIEKEQKKRYEDLITKTAEFPAEYKQAIDGMNDRINELTDIINKNVSEMKRPPSVIEGFDDPSVLAEHKAARKAFFKAIRKKGDLTRLEQSERELIVPDYMTPEKKALYAGDATTGGFFASTDFMNELMAYKLLISPMRSICRIQQTSGEKVQMPSLQNDAEVYWAVEQASYAESPDTTLGMINIPVHEIRGLMRISEQNLEDSLFNLESFVRERLGMRFARKEGIAFLSGTGNGQPRGILSYPIKASSGYTGGSAGKNNVYDAIPYVPSGVAANITSDSILNILMDLKSYYAPNATWVFTRATLNTIRLFKDAIQRPLWQPFAAGGLPATIYDRPYVEMPDMPEIAAGTYPILLGDFSYYLIVDRITLNFRQLNELYAASGLVGFIARMRVGGDCLLPEAFRVMKTAVS